MVADPADLYSLMIACAPVACALSAHYCVCFLIVKRTWPSFEDPWSLADLIAATLRNWVLIIPTFQATMALRHSVHLRWHGRTSASVFFQVAYVSWQVVHLGILVKQKTAQGQKLAMLMHHLLSIPCYFGSLMTGRMHFFACLDGCCEVTNVFLNFLYLCKDVSFGGKPLQKYIPGWVYILNGVFLWLSFLVLRLCLFPAFLYTMYSDVTASPEVTWMKTNTFEHWFNPLVTLFLLVLSTHWFIRITQGLLKAVSGGGGKKGEHKEE